MLVRVRLHLSHRCCLLGILIAELWLCGSALDAHAHPLGTSAALTITLITAAIAASTAPRQNERKEML